MPLKDKLREITVFLGCGFAAKYLKGGGNFSVPLQWMLGLKRLGLNGVWLELLPATKDPEVDRLHIQNFQKNLLDHGFEKNYCLLYQNPATDVHELERMECYGMTHKELARRLATPTLLLNLSHSIHPPLIYHFNRRIYCDIDPGEISYWMPKLEMGQSYHHSFWTIGLNRNSNNCKLPPAVVKWNTFFPLVDTNLCQPQPPPITRRFTTLGQWYWHQGIELDGDYPDLSKKASFETYISLPRLVPEVKMELAMNLNPDDPEIQRILSHDWNLVHPHDVADRPSTYRRYIAGSYAEFTACKGVDVPWRTGWLSDRAATYLSMGRPVITEDTGAISHLPSKNGFLWVSNLEEAADAIRRVTRDYEHLSQLARQTALECFDSVRNLERILGHEL